MPQRHALPDLAALEGYALKRGLRARCGGVVPLRLRGSVLAVLLAFSTAPLQAQSQVPLQLQGEAPRAPQRLSQWLAERDAQGAGYHAGLSWRVPGEQPAQLALKLELLQALAHPLPLGLSAAQADGLAARISAMPVTGRVPVAVADARWLEANPQRDPLLLPGHTVDLPARPATVSVLTPGGVQCRVAHVAGQEALAYVQACADLNGLPADWAWVAQPDGRIERYGIGLWNRTAQDPPAPGAWIWAPPRGAKVTERFSEQLIRFQATQGPAMDAAGSAVPKPAGQTALSPGTAATGLRWSSVAVALLDPPATAASSDVTERQISGTALQRGRSRDMLVTASDWGTVGLLQTHSARMRPEGSFVFHASKVDPYTRLNVIAQPFSWMEAGFRYTSIANRVYETSLQTGNSQSYKDKGFDVKLSLWSENVYSPELALGFVDIAGTGLFSSEYLVANKRFGAIDASLGVAWGNLAGVSRQFAAGTQPGNFDFSNYFSGKPSLFGGLQWTLPSAPLVLKAEYDSNNYQNEPLGNRLEQNSRINLGLTWRAYSWLDLTAGYERGNTFNIGLTLYTDLSRLSIPKLNDPPRVPVQAGRPLAPPDWSKTAQDVNEQSGWKVAQINAEGGQVAVTLEDPRGVYWQDRVDRTASVLHRDAPADAERFVLRYQTRGMPMAEQVIDRDEWVAKQTQPLPPSQQREFSLPREAEPVPVAAKPQFEGKTSPWSSNFRIGYAQNLGGPDSFVLYQIYAEQSAQLRLGRPDTWASGSVQLRLLDNYDKFTYTAPSNLPRVRTYLREYLTTSDFTMSNLQVTHARKISQNQYVSGYAGYLEEMFAGVGGEWLYRPFASRVAFGIDANYVAQRDFRQNFEMLDPAYKVATGHATLYWDTGWNGVEVRGSAGRYLAGDMGITGEVSRRFRNGVVLGAYATKTNVSAQEFGEGSFDKGLYLSIPFDAMFTRSSVSVANFDWKPLTRDGGAKLWRREQLYNITRTRDLRTFETTAAPLPNESVIPADHQPRWQPAAQAPAAHMVAAPRPVVVNGVLDEDTTYRIADALARQGFRNLAVEFDGAHRLNLKAAHDRLKPLGKAVGRAARTALNLAPEGVREIRIQLAEFNDPVVEYDFFDLKRLAAHFAGELPADGLRPFVAVRYINPGAREADPLAQLADVSSAPATPPLKDLVPSIYMPTRVIDDLGNAATAAGRVDWLKAGGIGLAAVLGSSVLDKRGYEFAKDHANAGWMKNLNNVGDALPWVGLAGAGLLALDGSDPRRARTGLSAAEAGVTAGIAATGLKYVFGRLRPNVKNSSPNDFEPFSSASNRDAMPSRHTAVAWALATPFAEEYRAPWLYGVAALTNLSRVGSQEHWFSDTVAGSLLGYGIGRLFWESSKANSSLPQVFVDPYGVNFSWTFY